jgi:hypothetical protein
MNKPPLPSSTLQECLRIALQFDIELIAGFLALSSVTLFLERWMGRGAYLFLGVFGLLLLLACLRRMVRKVIILRNAKGPMRGEGLWAFWAALLLPTLGLGVMLKLFGTEPAHKARQAEARIGLSAVYEAQLAFRGEFGKYSLGIRDLVSLPPGRVHFYTLAIPPACAIKEGLSPERAQLPIEDAPLLEARRREVEEYLRAVRQPEDCKDPKEGFEVYAVGMVKEGGPLDVWRVDEGGKIENVQRGF